MFKLYQREDCPYSVRVRRFLEEHHAEYIAKPVPKMGSERKELSALEGTTSMEVPVLVDGDNVVQGSDDILAYLTKVFTEKDGADDFGDPTYGLTRVLKNASFDDVVASTKEALATQEFGVITEIDVKATFKKKLDIDFRDYLIIGACNPSLAHDAIVAEPGIGLLLPCNVVVAKEHGGNVVVSAIDPRRVFSLVRRPDVEALATQVRQKLSAAMAQIELAHAG